jgi:DNA invertase Pin-like site-specific DNA recombinase
MHTNSSPAPHTGEAFRRRLHACLLARKSDKPGEDNCSLKDQKERGLAFIQAKGWWIDPEKDVVVQVVSGWKKSANREKIAELVDLTTAGQYDVVVLLKLDRFGRRVPEVTTYYDAMAEANVLLASVTEGVYDLTIPAMLAFAQMMTVHAQLESGNTSVRVSGARQAKRSRGFWMGGVPFGWEIDCEITPGGDRIYARADNGSKRLRRKAPESQVVDYIVTLADTEALNAGSIAKRLNTGRIASAKGGKWTDQTVRRILVNPVLAGWVSEWDYDPKTQRPVAWSVHPLRDAEGKPVQLHDAATSPEVYQRFYARFGPRQVSTRDRSGRALLTGLLFCGSHPSEDSTLICDGRLTGSANPQAKHKYHCPHEDDPTRCCGNRVSQIPLEGYVLALFLALISSGDFAQRHDTLVSAAMNREEDADGRLSQQIAELTELAEAHRQAAAAATNAKAALAASTNYDHTLERIEKANKSLSPIEPAPAALNSFTQLSAEECAQLFDEANRDQQRRWLAAVIDRIQLLPSTGRGARKGAFGSRGFDPRRVRIYLRHDPTTPITAPADWEGTAPDFGGPVSCPDCAKECKNRASLASHQRHAHGRVSKAKQLRGERASEFPCQQPQCGKILYNEAGLRIHLWHAHQVTDGYGCPEPNCDRRFALPAGVGRHLATTHSQEREFCAICGRTFKVGGLWLHINRAHPST